MQARTQHIKHDDIDLDAPLWGAAEMAPVIRRKERDVYHLIKTKQIDVTKKGALYVSTARRLRRSLGIE